MNPVESRLDPANAISSAVAERDAGVPDGWQAVRSPVTASEWNVAVAAGQRVVAGEKMVVLEAMKMEIAVAAPSAAVVEKLNCVAGAHVAAGQALLHIRAEAAA